MALSPVVPTGKVKPVQPEKYAMPTPPAVVVWRNCPGGDPANAIVTKLGRSAISVMLFPPDSRVGVPKDGVRFVDDPANKANGNSDSGVWDYTDETKLISDLVAKLSK